MKIQLAAKFQKKTDGQLSGISPDRRTDERTDGRTGLITISPFPTKVGGLKNWHPILVGTEFSLAQFKAIFGHIRASVSFLEGV